MKKTFLAGILCIILCLCTYAAASRADEISDLENEITEEKRKKQEAEANAAFVAHERDLLMAKLEAVEGESEIIWQEILSLNEDIETARGKIEAALETRQQLEEELKSQKEAMALRIQYTYEQGSASVWEIIAGARSLSEILNSAEYISSMASYDKMMMEKYENTLAEEEAQLALMLAEEDNLSGLLEVSSARQQEYAQKAEEMMASIQQYNGRVAAYSEQAENYQKEIDDLNRKLDSAREAARKAAEEAARRKAEEEERRRRAEALAAAQEAQRRAEEEAARQAREAEEQRRKEEEARIKAEEEARRRAEAAANQPQGSGGTPAPSNPDLPKASDARGVGSLDIDPNGLTPCGYTNLELLAAIIDVEAGNQVYDGRVAVGNIILNRIRDPRFQKTIYDVIHGPGQFPPATSGVLDMMLAKGARASSFEAARDVLNGVQAIGTQWLYFCSSQSWNARHPRHTEYIQIGNHFIYY